jgi:AraC-like DNA-binding protein
MDPLSEVLRTVRLTGATFFSAEFRKPWGFISPAMHTFASRLASGPREVVLYHLVTEGHATVRIDGDVDVHLGPGDVVVFPHGDAHRIWHGRTKVWQDTSPAVARALQGDLQVTRAGGDGEVTRFVCGFFSCEKQAGRLFLAGLPPLLKVAIRDDPGAHWIEEAVRFLAAEAASDRPGRLALLAKLSEALFVETLRRAMVALPDEQTGWLAAARDLTAGRALALLHREPARDWTVDALAHEVGASRSTLVERFSQFLGEPPMTYLARWRLHHGAKLLETTSRAIIEIAGDVGYESEAAFNRAFKREFGVPPGRYRRARAGEAVA